MHRHLFAIALLWLFTPLIATAATCATSPNPLPTNAQSESLVTLAATLQRQPPTSPAAITARLERADLYRVLGRYSDAHADLQQALQAATATDQRQLQALATQAQGQVYAQQRQLSTAETHLRRALTLAQQLDQPPLVATVANSLGNVLLAQNQRVAAQSVYQTAWSAAQLTDDPGLRAAVLVNLARVAGAPNQTLRQLQQAHATSAAVTNPAERIPLLLSIATQAQAVNSTAALVHTSLNEAQTLAADNGFARWEAQALAELSAVAAKRGDRQLALQHLTHALARLPLNAYDLRYRWEWQLGQLLAATGDRPRAIAAYRRAADHLQRIRFDIPIDYTDGQSSFRTTFAPLYLGLADLLLQESAARGNSPITQTLLRDARDAVEQVKLDELRDYFRDVCILPLREEIGTVTATAAVFYPVLFDDRLELLVSIGDQFYQTTLPLTRADLAPVAEILALKLRHDKPAAAEAAQLYEWLMTPIQPWLTSHAVDTVIFIPDGPLRAVPLAALQHDGRYVIQDYAVVTVPGLKLLQPETLAQNNATTLLAGLSRPGPVIHDLPSWWVNALVQQHRGRGEQRGVSVAVRGHADAAAKSAVRGASEAEKIAALSLPGVEQEITQLAQQLPAQTLQNQDFLLNRFVTEVQDQSYQVVHIASHGLFQGPPEENFIVTYDRKLDMKTLARALQPKELSQRPIELLVLSACQTAEGDDRTPLGLSGVALQSGARSALGSLWPVGDNATQLLMTRFYEALQRPGMTKARALQAAQQALIAGGQYTQPNAWAGFILVGNWL